MASLQDGTKLTTYLPGNDGHGPIRIWDTEDFMGKNLFCNTWRDGWMIYKDDGPLFWALLTEMVYALFHV